MSASLTYRQGTHHSHPRIAAAAGELLSAIEASLERALASSDLPDQP